MKLRRQAPAKAFIAAAAAGLLFGLFGLIKSEPRLKAQTTGSEGQSVDYGRFFAPSAASDARPPPSPHTRTSAS